ncbi:acyl-CoA dehydrogenase [Massilia sp. ML15P13]|uniref:Acyl-CoA dehydrogenase n=1 Tax=Telluria aromaticivorans TaxID=2725995 RepID=A0A7Y2JUY1_9BURK|nr:acyl-CoA dehydrogenase [Telluria aromaticivorans]
MNQVDDTLAAWLDSQADALDSDHTQADQLLATLAASGVFGAAVPVAQGGAGGAASTAVALAAALAEHSLAAGFVFWAQRATIECLLRSPNHDLVRKLLPSLLNGATAGAPGLSNAIRSLSGLDQLHAQCTSTAEGSVLNGTVPWATNLCRGGFVAAIAAINPASGSPAIFAVPNDAAGVWRGDDQDLLGLRATNTASLRFENVPLTEHWLLHPHAKVFLPALRPMMLAIQCGLGLGLARASLVAARRHTPGQSVLAFEIGALEDTAEEFWRTLSVALDGGWLEANPTALFDLRLNMVGLATSAVQLELQALGARAYDRSAGSGFARRMREAAFLPILTPSLVQLKTELAKLGPASVSPSPDNLPI